MTSWLQIAPHLGLPGWGRCGSARQKAARGAVRSTSPSPPLPARPRAAAAPSGGRTRPGSQGCGCGETVCPHPPPHPVSAHAAQPRLAPLSDGRPLTACASRGPAEPGVSMVPAARRQQSSRRAGARRTTAAARAWRAAASRRSSGRRAPPPARATLPRRGPRGVGGAGRPEGRGAEVNQNTPRPSGAGPARCQPIRARPVRHRPIGTTGSRVIRAWPRRDRAGRDAARVLVAMRGRGLRPWKVGERSRRQLGRCGAEAAGQRGQRLCGRGSPRAGWGGGQRLKRPLPEACQSAGPDGVNLSSRGSALGGLNLEFAFFLKNLY